MNINFCWKQTRKVWRRLTIKNDELFFNARLITIMVYFIVSFREIWQIKIATSVRVLFAETLRRWNACKLSK